jgi:hypothetical protein
MNFLLRVELHFAIFFRSFFSVELPYIFSAGVWGQCSAACGPGMQPRALECALNPRLAGEIRKPLDESEMRPVCDDSLPWNITRNDDWSCSFDEFGCREYRTCR